jgi:hypothetical protein
VRKKVLMLEEWKSRNSIPEIGTALDLCHAFLSNVVGLFESTKTNKQTNKQTNRKLI